VSLHVAVLNAHQQMINFDCLLDICLTHSVQHADSGHHPAGQQRRHACICRESAHTHVDNNLPFELKVLEAALTRAVTMMEQDAVKLNQQISPILESLAYKVSAV